MAEGMGARHAAPDCPTNPAGDAVRSAGSFAGLVASGDLRMPPAPCLPAAWADRRRSGRPDHAEDGARLAPVPALWEAPCARGRGRGRPVQRQAMAGQAATVTPQAAKAKTVIGVTGAGPASWERQTAGPAFRRGHNREAVGQRALQAQCFLGRCREPGIALLGRGKNYRHGLGVDWSHGGVRFAGQKGE